MKTCPFCGHDCRSLIKAHRDDANRDMPDSAGLCGKCGELLVINLVAVRKPTDSEYLELGQQQEVKLARATWQRVSELAGHHDSGTIERIRQLMADMPAHIRDPATVTLIQGSALLGAAMAIGEIKQRLQDSRDYDDFFVSLLVLEQLVSRERDQLMNNYNPTTHTRSKR